MKRHPIPGSSHLREIGSVDHKFAGSIPGTLPHPGPRTAVPTCRELGEGEVAASAGCERTRQEFTVADRAVPLSQRAGVRIPQPRFRALNA